jgi:hypothetical protein
MSTPRSMSSDDSSSIGSVEIDLEFNSVKQVSELQKKIVKRYNEVMIELEVLESTDDDIQELREAMLDKYEYECLAEAYEALNERVTAEGLRNQALECNERIEELQQALEDVDIKEHHMELYDLEIKRSTLEIQLKACEKYLERHKRKDKIEAGRAALRPASPRRYQAPARAASPSRLAPVKKDPPTPPPEKTKTDRKKKGNDDSNLLPLPKMDVLPPKKIGRK